MLLCVPEGMEHISQGCGWLVLLSLGLLLEAAGDGSRAHGCEQVTWVLLVAGRGLWMCGIGTRPACRAVRAFSGGLASLWPHPPGGWGEGAGW